MDPVCVAIPQVEKFPEYKIHQAPSPSGSPALGPRRYTPSNLSILDNRSENPYRVRSPEDEHKALIKNVKGILNKITPEKYDQLSQSLCEIEFDATKQEVVCLVIGCVFEAAVKQSIFCGLFADLCKDLMAYHQRKNMKEGQEKAAKASFRRALLNRCQEEFERPQPVPTDVPPEDRKALEVRFKQRQLGNIKFIAELFRRKMLVEKIMHEVIKRLLLGTERSPDYIPTDEDIEVLHKLLYTAGKLLDRPEAASYMERYFTRIKELSKTHPRSRMRFMLQDLIELRTNAWVQRREEEKAQTFAELESAFATKSRDKETHSKSNSINSNTNTSNNEKDRRAPFRQIQTTCTSSQYCNPDIYTPSMIGTPPQIQSKPTWIVMPQGTVQQCWETCQPNVVNTIPPANKSPLARPVPCTAPFEIQLSNRLAALAQSSNYNQEIIPTCITDNSNKEMNDMELEKAAMQILSEFQTSQQLEDLLYSLSLLGHQNHPGFINKAIQISVSSLVRHSATRTLLTEMLRILINVELNDSRNLTQDSIYSGFRQFLSDAIENSMSEDNPRIWESFAELLVMCVQAFPFPCLQYVVPPSFVNSEYAGVLVLCILNKIAEISYRERANPMASANLIRLLFGEYVTATYLEHLRCQLSGPTTYTEGTLGACKLLATPPY